MDDPVRIRQRFHEMIVAVRPMVFHRDRGIAASCIDSRVLRLLCDHRIVSYSSSRSRVQFFSAQKILTQHEQLTITFPIPASWTYLVHFHQTENHVGLELMFDGHLWGETCTEGCFECEKSVSNERVRCSRAQQPTIRNRTRTAAILIISISVHCSDDSMTQN